MDHEPVAVPAHTPAAGGGLHTHATARAAGGRRRAAEAHRASRTRLPLRDPEHFTEVRLDRPLVGGDAMAPRPNGSLVVSTTGLGPRARTRSRRSGRVTVGHRRTRCFV